MSSLRWPVCLTEGPLLHEPWACLSAAVLKRALSSRLATFPPCSEGLTVLLGLNEEEFALPWQKISHSPWQLWQLVMAACWWGLCNPPPLPPLPWQSPPLLLLLLLLLSPSYGALEMPESLSFFSFFSTIRTTKWKYIIPVSLAAREGNKEQDPWRGLSDMKELKSTQGNLQIYIQSSPLWKPGLHSWHPIFLADTPCKIDQYELVTSSSQERRDGTTGDSMHAELLSTSFVFRGCTFETKALLHTMCFTSYGAFYV